MGKRPSRSGIRRTMRLRKAREESRIDEEKTLLVLWCDNKKWQQAEPERRNSHEEASRTRRVFFSHEIVIIDRKSVV